MPRWVLDTVLVAATTALIISVLSSERVHDDVAMQPAHLLLTLAAAAVGTGAAILAVVASRLLGDHRPAWIAAALVLYCVVLLPWSAVVPIDTLDPAQRASRLIAHLATLVLLVLSIRPPRRLGSWGGWLVLATGALLAVGALWLPAGIAVNGLVDGPVPTSVILLGWVAAAVAFAVDGVRTRSSPRFRLGLGLVVLAIAQLHRVVTTGPLEGLTFAGLRLAALAIVLVGLAELVREALVALRAEQWLHQEELAEAALNSERAAELAAERNHELRNGLAGLAGITHLLGAEAHGADHDRLEQAVLAELGRLHMILDGGVAEPGPGTLGAGSDYLVEPVLAGLILLRTSGGDRQRLRLRVEPGLRAHGHSAVLAQVVTNLLANCDRHAPGSPVTVVARRVVGPPAGVVVEVRDGGPGLLPGTEEAVLGRGFHDAAAGGSGLGLDISRRLVEREGGTLALRSVERPRGCLATVTLPPALLPVQASAPTTPIVVRSHR